MNGPPKLHTPISLQLNKIPKSVSITDLKNSGRITPTHSSSKRSSNKSGRRKQGRNTVLNDNFSHLTSPAANKDGKKLSVTNKMPNYLQLGNQIPKNKVHLQSLPLLQLNEVAQGNYHIEQIQPRQLSSSKNPSAMVSASPSSFIPPRQQQSQPRPDSSTSITNLHIIPDSLQPPLQNQGVLPGINVDNELLVESQILTAQSTNEHVTRQIQQANSPSQTQKINLSLHSINKNKHLNECKNSLEFIIIAFCKTFNFTAPLAAAHFFAGGMGSQYAQCLKKVENFGKINQFLSLLQTNLKTLINILEEENDYQKNGISQMSNSAREGSHCKIMNLLSMGLSLSVDERIVWQTCNLLSAIFQNVNGIQINNGFQTLMIRWALNLDEAGNFKGIIDPVNLSHNQDFISSCFTAQNNHLELHNVITGLFYEVANMGRSKRKWERQIDNTKLVELFCMILPEYFTHENQFKYFDMMQDILNSHNFQFEKERIDKQHLLFKIVDQCLYHLSLINNVTEDDPGEIQKLKDSANLRQSCMSLLTSIWENNLAIFELSLKKFIAHFVQLFKPDDKNVANSLRFDYIEYQQQTKLNKIVLLLLKRNLKDPSKLVRISTYSQLFKLLMQFTKRAEIDLMNIVFKLLVFQLVDQLQNYKEADTFDVREILGNYIAQFIKVNDKANVSFICEMLLKAVKQQLAENFIRQPIFNQSDNFLIKQIMYHPRTTPLVAVMIWDTLTIVLFSEKSHDYSTHTLIAKYLNKLMQRFEHELSSKWFKLLQVGLMAITKLDMQLALIHHKLANNNSCSTQQIQATLRLLKSDKEKMLLANLLLKRQIIFQVVLELIKKSKGTIQDTQSIKFCANDLINKFLEKQPKCYSIKILERLVNDKNYNFAAETLRSQDKDEIMLSAQEDGQIKGIMQENQVASLQPNNTINFNKAVKVKVARQTTDVKEDQKLNSIKLIKRETKVFKGPKKQETIQTGKAEFKNTGEREQEEYSPQTTLRTEIYTSEDEEEMMNYYTYLSTYKKEVIAEDKKERPNSAKSQTNKESIVVLSSPAGLLEKQETKKKDTKQVRFQINSNTDRLQPKRKTSDSKNPLYRSNSITGHVNKLMEEATHLGNLIRTKEQLQKPEDNQLKVEKRLQKTQTKKIAKRRSSFHLSLSTRLGQKPRIGDRIMVELEEIEFKGQNKTDRMNFINTLKKNFNETQKVMPNTQRNEDIQGDDEASQSLSSNKEEVKQPSEKDNEEIKKKYEPKQDVILEESMEVSQHRHFIMQQKFSQSTLHHKSTDNSPLQNRSRGGFSSSNLMQKIELKNVATAQPTLYKKSSLFHLKNFDKATNLQMQEANENLKLSIQAPKMPHTPQVKVLSPLKPNFSSKTILKERTPGPDSFNDREETNMDKQSSPIQPAQASSESRYMETKRKLQPIDTKLTPVRTHDVEDTPSIVKKQINELLKRDEAREQLRKSQIYGQQLAKFSQISDEERQRNIEQSINDDSLSISHNVTSIKHQSLLQNSQISQPRTMQHSRPAMIQLNQEQFLQFLSQMQSLQQIQLNLQMQMQQLSMQLQIPQFLVQQMEQANHMAAGLGMQAQAFIPRQQHQLQQVRQQLPGYPQSQFNATTSSQSSKGRFGRHRLSKHHSTNSIGQRFTPEIIESNLQHMKKQAEKEFTATINSINLNKEQIDNISQKASERIREMKQKRLNKRAISQDLETMSAMSQVPVSDFQRENSPISQNSYLKSGAGLLPQPTFMNNQEHLSSAHHSSRQQLQPQQTSQFGQTGDQAPHFMGALMFQPNRQW